MVLVSSRSVRSRAISGMFDDKVYAMDFFKLSKINRPSSTPLTMDAKLSFMRIMFAASWATSPNSPKFLKMHSFFIAVVTNVQRTLTYSVYVTYQKRCVIELVYSGAFSTFFSILLSYPVHKICLMSSVTLWGFEPGLFLFEAFWRIIKVHSSIRVILSIKVLKVFARINWSILNKQIASPSAAPMLCEGPILSSNFKSYLECFTFTILSHKIKPWYCQALAPNP